MDKLTRYRDIARRVVQEYAGVKPSHGQIDSFPVIDPEGDHYMAYQVGWDKHRRVDGAFVHLDIIGGKIWIQYDGTNRPVADELEAAGVPKEDIVLGEKPPNVRAFTGYGVG
jgi:XisI protein